MSLSQISRQRLADSHHIGPKPCVMRIVPQRNVVRPAVLLAAQKDNHELVSRPLSSPTGPGGAAGFRNRAGSQIAEPLVQNVYLGDFWGDKQVLETVWKAVVANGYLDPLGELGYGTGSGTYLGSVEGPPVVAPSRSEPVHRPRVLLERA